MDLIDQNSGKKQHGPFDEVSSEIVDTTKVRLIDINFTMGGHHYVYPDLIEENKIFIDDRMDKDNIIATLIHEYTERLFMKFYGIEYENAHKLSNKVEIVVRQFMASSLPGLDKSFIKGR